MTNFKKLLVAAIDESLEHKTKLVESIIRLDASLTPQQAALMVDASVRLTKAVMENLGDIVDGITPAEGLNLIVMKYIAGTAINDLNTFQHMTMNMLTTALFENDDRIPRTPNCECPICAIADELNGCIAATESSMQSPSGSVH